MASVYDCVFVSVLVAVAFFFGISIIVTLIVVTSSINLSIIIGKIMAFMLVAAKFKWSFRAKVAETAKA